MRVQLTATGRRRVDAALTDLTGREHTILATLDADAQTTLAGLLRRVVAPFDA